MRAIWRNARLWGSINLGKMRSQHCLFVPKGVREDVRELLIRNDMLHSLLTYSYDDTRPEL